jgi:hypothetical protein
MLWIVGVVCAPLHDVPNAHARYIPIARSIMH